MILKTFGLFCILISMITTVCGKNFFTYVQFSENFLLENIEGNYYCRNFIGNYLNLAGDNVLTIINQLNSKLENGVAAGPLSLSCNNDPDSSYDSKTYTFLEVPITGYSIDFSPMHSCYIGEVTTRNGSNWPCSILLGKKDYTVTYRIAESNTEFSEQILDSTISEAVDVLRKKIGTSISNFSFSESIEGEDGVISTNQGVLPKATINFGNISFLGTHICGLGPFPSAYQPKCSDFF